MTKNVKDLVLIEENALIKYTHGPVKDIKRTYQFGDISMSRWVIFELSPTRSILTHSDKSGRIHIIFILR